ncbi:MAG: hypothetical protein ABJE66_10285 [Deltaproteobacteria bacterium]
MTRGQRLSVEHPHLSNVIDQVGSVAKGGAGGQINITISNVRKLPTKVDGVGDFYEAKFTARAKGEDQPMWSKTIYAKRIPNSNGARDKIYFELPADDKMLLSAPPDLER